MSRDGSAFACQEIERRLERLQEEIHKAGRKIDADAVHDVRVATRRLRQALRVFANMAGKKEAKRLRRELKPLMEAGGAVRDCDIAMELLSKASLSGQHPLWDELRAERAGAESRFRRRLGGVRVHLDVKQHAHPLPGLAPLVHPYFEQGRGAAQPKTPAADLHAFRLATKRLRYTLELFKPLYGPALAARIEELRQIQEFLGQANDARVTAARLAPRLRRDPALEPAWKFLEQQAREFQAGFRAFWRQRMDSNVFESRWNNYLRRRRAPLASAHQAGG